MPAMTMQHYVTEATAPLKAEIESLRAQLAERNWISVDDGLPENDLTVICANNDELLDAKYRNGRWVQDREDDTVYHVDVTHWMSLPKSPNKDK